MAQNIVSPPGTQYLPVPSGTLSGAPVVVGKIAGVAETDRDTAGKSTVNTRPGTIASVPVKGIDGSGNAAVAVGDYIYHTVADTPPLSKKATGVLWGKAEGTVGSGLTATINVMLIQA